MRRSLVLVLLAYLLFPFASPTRAEEFHAGQVVIVDIPTIAVRNQPSTTSVVVTTVVQGDKLTILNDTPSNTGGTVWWNVQIYESDVTGWLPAAAFSAFSPADNAECWTDEQHTEVDDVSQWTAPPAMTIEQQATYIATITTTIGTIVLQLDAANAPIATNNFICLANAGYYDGTDFHRVSSDFLIQGGDATGTGTGSPGYSVPSDPTTGSYPAGSVALATANPGENGSQFFIAVTDLDGKIPNDYPVFGEVTSGQDVVAEISHAAVESNPRGELSQPVEPISIVSIEIAEQADEVGPPLPTTEQVPTAAPSPTPTVEAAPTVLLPPTDSEAIELDAKDIAFVPTEITIDASDAPVMIRMKNTGAALHNFSIDSLGIDVDVDPGETVEFVIPAGTAPGTYDFYCNVPGHKEAGMVGKLVVIGVSAPAEPTSATSSGHTCEGLEAYQSDFEFAMFTAFMANPEATDVLLKWEEPDFDPYGLTSPEYELLSELFAAMAAGLQDITPPSYASVWHSLQVDAMLFSSVLYEDASTSGPYMADFTHNPEYLSLESRLPGAVRSAQSCPNFADWAEGNSLLGE